LATSPQPEPQPNPSVVPEPAEPSNTITPPVQHLTATGLLITVNVLIFCTMLVYSIHVTGVEKFLNTPIGQNFDSGILLAWGSDFGPRSLGGQFWRVVTSTFVHGDFWHLFMNMLFLWGLGTALDQVFSRAQALAIYLIAGAAASLFSLAWDPQRNSFGASGAVFGQAGMLIVLLGLAKLDLPRRKTIQTWIWLAFSMPFDVFFGHLSKTTDYAAHAGGFVSGLVIGLLFAWTFRVSPPKRILWQRRFLGSAAAALVTMLIVVTQFRGDVIKKYEEFSLDKVFPDSDKTPVTRVFVRLTGDARLVRRTWNIFNVELEDAGVTVVSKEAEADAVLLGEIGSQIKRTSIVFDVIQMRISANGNLEKIESCESLTTNENGVDFLRYYSAEDVVHQIRQKHPNAQTVKLDPASDISLSKSFATALPAELKASGFTVTNSGSADIILRVNLAYRKVAVDEMKVKYNLRATTRDGAMLVTSKSSEVLSAKLAEPAPAVCPDRFADLDFLRGNEFATAHRFVKNLTKANSKLPANNKSGKEK
jgi:membrane associated rhomboid family serine protease